MSDFQVPATVAAYAAGVIDGDGSIYVGSSGRGQFKPVIKIEMHDYAVTDWFHAIFPINVANTRRTVAETTWGIWRTSRVGAVSHILDAITPYLVEKRRTSLYLQAYIAENVENRRRRRTLRHDFRNRALVGRSETWPIEHFRRLSPVCQAAYTAGVFEAEGCVHDLSRVSVSGNCRPLLAALHDTYGGALFPKEQTTRRNEREGAGRVRENTWQVTGETAAQLLALLLPHMKGDSKALQSQLFVDWHLGKQNVNFDGKPLTKSECINLIRTLQSF